MFENMDIVESFKPGPRPASVIRVLNEHGIQATAADDLMEPVDPYRGGRHGSVNVLVPRALAAVSRELVAKLLHRFNEDGVTERMDTGGRFCLACGHGIYKAEATCPRCREAFVVFGEDGGQG